MSVTITYASLTTLINALSSSPSTAENIIDQAINKLVTNGITLDNLSGVAGAKSGTYTQAQAGAILELAVATYAQTYVTSGASSSAFSLQGVSKSQSSSSSGSAMSLQDLARELANQLKSRSFKRA